MVMVIILMMMMRKMKVMMPELAQYRHGEGELADGGDYLHGDNGDHLLVMIVMALHLLETDSEQVIFVIFIMLTMAMMMVIMLVVVAGSKRS